MATTTATVTINSSDITGDALSLSTTTTLYKAEQTVGLENTSGVARTLVAAAAATNLSSGLVNLFLDAKYTNDGAHKVYIANKATDATHKATVLIENVVIGVLYAGDWMFIPWTSNSTTTPIGGAGGLSTITGVDIKIATSHANMVLEHMIISE